MQIIVLLDQSCKLFDQSGSLVLAVSKAKNHPQQKLMVNSLGLGSIFLGALEILDVVMLLNVAILFAHFEYFSKLFCKIGFLTFQVLYKHIPRFWNPEAD